MTSNVDPRIALLDAMDDTAAGTRLREHTYRLFEPATGGVVLDIGCGAARAVAELVERGHRAVGVDTDQEVLSVARERWPHAELCPGTATSLPIGDGAAISYRADKVLHGLDDPVTALAEASRVLARGGRIVLLDQYWAALTVSGLSPSASQLTTAIMAARSDAMPSPRLPDRYVALLCTAGFVDVAVHTHLLSMPGQVSDEILTRAAKLAVEIGVATKVAASDWLTELANRTDPEPVRLPMAVPEGRRP